MKAKAICRGLIAFGPLLVGCVYLTWIVARFSLGYWPRPSLDDPKDIPWVGLPRWITMSLFMISPAIVLAGICAAGYSWGTKDPERAKRALELLAGLAVFAACMLFVGADPFQVWLWFMD